MAEAIHGYRGWCHDGGRWSGLASPTGKEFFDCVGNISAIFFMRSRNGRQHLRCTYFDEGYCLNLEVGSREWRRLTVMIDLMQEGQGITRQREEVVPLIIRSGSATMHLLER